MPIKFKYRQRWDDASTTESFTTRFDPYNVNWTYNVNTSVTDTYAGQVIQVLSINWDTLTIEGQFGKEGVFGMRKAQIGTSDEDRYGSIIQSGDIAIRGTQHQYEYSPKFGIPGLMAMTEFFRTYFAVQSQGGDREVPGRFLQAPMYISYTGLNTEWKVYPTTFPSYRLANDNFAPMWKVDCEVVEAPIEITKRETNAALERINKAIGFKPANPFSDPLLTWEEFDKISNQIISNYKGMLPDFTEGQLLNMIWTGISRPIVDPLTKEVIEKIKITGAPYRSSNRGDSTVPGSSSTVPVVPPGIVPTGTTQQLAKQLLVATGWTGDRDQIQSIADGHTLTNQCPVGGPYPTSVSLDSKLLQQLLYIVQSGFTINITALVSDHRCVCNGCDHASPHSLGQGCDIGTINGHNLGSDSSQGCKDAVVALEDLLSVCPVKPSQVICDGVAGSHDDTVNAHSFGWGKDPNSSLASDHRNHVHITSS